ncbi:UDP-4-amino-4,6-dideoxy-N-acetyl-beta-L-altrosamine N-acetyltransferase [Campylobacter sp. MIT 12-5580]|uniref:UDP-4-amino-4, 6-dideoxy-N-acetyl-beta-L-altrosamine N-acetyltransferase n=1 Tax=Campylobacter sp. MIT 12-5580 TaxID=2040651 RepID=UPI0010F6CB99|nr:UDP-4-amino-4,6-dideoxy-N-acetyl-beta-L-altrosamine N-acetyltransferase [Campylobacter sp. MIT 12-5580]TKX30205.1 UDP-4-amino-4,6-dideoxy-N-acetyl-beta-L-altrosamine N-acetyltransferase [Campylobacter sp. MIT 12-5580]
MKLKNFIELNNQEIKLVYKWRMKQAENMLNKYFSFNEHKKFIKDLPLHKDKRYFLCFYNDEMIGVIYFINICKQTTEFGLYQNPNLKGNGKNLMKAMLAYAFNELKLIKIKARAFKHNEKAIKLYLDFGFCLDKEDEKMKYFHLIK